MPGAQSLQRGATARRSSTSRCRHASVASRPSTVVPHVAQWAARLAGDRAAGGEHARGVGAGGGGPRGRRQRAVPGVDRGTAAGRRGDLGAARRPGRLPAVRRQPRQDRPAEPRTDPPRHLQAEAAGEARHADATAADETAAPTAAARQNLPGGRLGPLLVSRGEQHAERPASQAV